MDDIDRRAVMRFMAAIEDGTLPVGDAYNLLKDFDPLLAYFLLRYLREKHASEDRASGAGARLLDLLGTYPDAAKLAKTPHDEPMVEWFDDSHAMRSFFAKPADFTELIIDKLEG